jgi:hypothetical protein
LSILALYLIKGTVFLIILRGAAWGIGVWSSFSFVLPLRRRASASALLATSY